MRKGVLFFVLFYVSSLVLLTGEEIFAPFVSSLTATVQDNKISLSWKKAPSALEHYVIFRSRFEISAETFTDAVNIGSVDADLSSFIYTPPDTLDYYYAVLGRNDKDTLYKLFIPYRNVLMQPVSVVTVLPPDQIVTAITDLRATTSDNAVQLSFVSSRPNRSVIIYRSTNPIKEAADLVPATAITTVSPNQNIYNDYPIPGVPYYYAVFDAESIKSGQYNFVPAENSLTKPVMIDLEASGNLFTGSTESQRITPLPFLLLNSGILTGDRISREMNYAQQQPQLDDETIQSWKSLSARIRIDIVPVSAFTPQILSYDTLPDLSGEDLQLSSIVRPIFSVPTPGSVNWTLAEKQITSFLNVRHSKPVIIRAHFYLGQIYYFQGKYTESFFEFLMAGDIHYNDVRPWLDTLFQFL